MFKHLREEIPEEADVGGQVGYREAGERKHKPRSTGTRWKPALKVAVNVPSHEAVDGLQVVPRAQQEEREADDDEEAAQVDEGVLREEPPETGPSVVDWDVLALGRNTGKSRGTRRRRRTFSVPA